jgi:Tol biopolymer transport system component
VALISGTRLGPYEIVALLGVGGMGEVYRARDPRLERDVAIKILPTSFASDTERLRRFEQEARAVAALNHPNIVAVHDTGEEGATHYIVTELLSGESLRERLAAGPLSPRRAYEFALQIANGLAAAHERGIVHRDLKPENIFICRDQRLKLLDFGLAKQNSLTASAGADAAAVTRDEITSPGMVLGTVGYMSPEQVRGKAADHRSDIFAFGAVFFEMLTGARAFQRDSAAETMAAILRNDPPEASTIGAAVAPAVERIVRRCLEKDPADRFQSAKDLGFALEGLTGSPAPSSASSAAAPAVVASKPRSWQPWAAMLAVLAVAGAAGYWAGARRPASQPTFQQLTYQRGYIRGARFLPDGHSVVYSAMWEGRPYEVFTSRIGDRNARSLEVKNAMVVGIADSGDIALLTNVQRARTTNWMQSGTLARVPVSGGAPREILENVWDADISRDGKDFAVVRTTSGPHQLEYPVGNVRFKTNGYIDHPRISPDGKSVAFMEHPIFGDNRGYVALADSKGVRRLTPEASAVEGLAWSPDGREVWYAATARSQRRMVWAVTPGANIRKVFETPTESSVWDIAPDGRLLLSSETLSSAQMVAAPASAPERDVSALGFANFGAIADDGKSIVFTESGPSSGEDYLVFYRRLDGSAAIELGNGSANGVTPDGKYAVVGLPTRPTVIRLLPIGAGEPRDIDVAPIDVDRDVSAWFPGAREIVFLGHEGINPPHAYRVSLAGGPAVPLTRGEGARFWNKVSPDGKYVLQGPGVATNWGDLKMTLVDLSTGAERPAMLQPGDEPAQWDKDARHIYVARETDTDASLYRVDVFTGERQLLKTIRPPDPAGVLSLSRFYITPSGSAYTYNMTRVLSALYIYKEK